MSDFQLRALEIHSQYVWDVDWVTQACRFAREHGMTALVLHRNDFIEQVVYPGKYFGCEREMYRNIFERYQDIYRVLYKYTPVRRSGPYQRRAYFKRILKIASDMGLEVYVENKELNFPHIFIELFPYLVKNGCICPSEPFWFEFVRTKYTEFFSEFPEVSGIITSPATRESMVSISSNRCQCELCKEMTPEEWYEKLILAMYEPIDYAGKTLVIRDFVFDSKSHQEITSAMEKFPSNVVISLKNTPHDYYPTFPDNERIGRVGTHPQWVEFDCMGQYFGWGIGISVMTNDMRRRMKYSKERGVEGVVFRTDWESLDSHSAFHTLNVVNLYAAAALSKNLDTTNAEIYGQWLEENGFYKPGITEVEKGVVISWIIPILDETWEVVRRTVFSNDCVFSDSSTLPVSMDHAFWLAEEKNSLKDWVPAKADALCMSKENLKLLLDEKDEALTRVIGLLNRVRQGCEGMSEQGHIKLIESFDVFARYVNAFRAASRAIFLTKYLLVSPCVEPTVKVEWQSAMRELIAVAEELRSFYTDTCFRYAVYTLLDPERLLALHGDLQRRVQASQVEITC
ncbi:hypothetical protein [Alicyclobacillus macrosporangiidus]|uniref:hypothetical protein n=1 Tax=Alicyclobacillus macrosporangiidus TaxID=392015 RepID=UPI0004959A77|nr:hypothetical protein [Alicyclobacillus macrosporangiidus]